MPRYLRGFVIPEVGLIHAEYQKLIRLARDAGQPYHERVLTLSYGQWQKSLDELAIATASDATARIKRRLAQTARRPDTGVRPHIRDNIVCRPLRGFGPFATGSVGIADLDRLERVVNPDDPAGVPYWIVQEEGTRANVGREIRGFFYNRGFTNQTPPRSGFTGTPNAQPLFRPGTLIPGPRGGLGGKGVIRNPIPARHFVRDGANAARNDWRAGVRLIERTAISEIRAALAPTRGSRVGPRRVAPRRPRLR